uniref:Uncharacterized protein n=1 Tax=uncultured marine virus TaxID=186617 RepID=S4TE23_9VIRU|nr:hypothetical protein [uncultured marine virus]
MAQTKTSAKKTTTKSMRKRSAKVKQEPTTRYLRYELTNSATPTTETSHYIDLARDLSAVNRRLYRQGKDYHVKKITIVSSNTPNGDSRVSVATIPSGWSSQMAWKRAFRTWNEMNKTAAGQLSGDITGTWSDFKVSMTRDFQNATKAVPLDNGGNAYLLGDWIYTKLVTPDGTTGADEFDMHMLGGHFGAAGAWSSVGLIKSYGESRATVQANDPSVPNAASSDPLVNVFDYGTTVDEVIDLMEADNDSPPYSLAFYPGSDGNGPKPAVVQDTTLMDGRATMAGFTAMCGMLEFEIKSPLPSDVYSVLVELAPGKYRGIHAESI